MSSANITQLLVALSEADEPDGAACSDVDLVTRLARNAEFRAESCHRFAVEQAGDETETLIAPEQQVVQQCLAPPTHER